MSILDYNITKNVNDAYYHIEIITDSGSIIYDRAVVKFLTGDLISFPYAVSVLDRSDNVVHDWDLTRSPGAESGVDAATAEE